MGNLKSNSVNHLTIGKETTLGTAVTPTAFLKNTGFSGGLKYDTVESKSRTGSRAPNGFYRVGQIGALSIPFEADADNMGWFLKGLLGSEAVATIGGGEYGHTFTMLNASALPSFTLETGIGGYKVFRDAGAVVNSLSLEVAAKAIITGTAEYTFMSQTDQAKSFTDASINTTTDKITVTAHGYSADTPVKVARVGTATMPGGISEDTVYYIKSPATNDFSLAATAGGSAIDITSAGSGSFEVVQQNAIAAGTTRPFLFNDGTATIDAVANGEIQSLSLNMSNNLFTDDIRLNGTGGLSSVPAGQFKADGKLKVVFNEDSIALKTKFQNNQSVAMTFTLDTGVTVGSGTIKLIVTIATASISNIDISAGGDFATMDVDFLCTGSNPIQFELRNSKATAY